MSRALLQAWGRTRRRCGIDRAVAQAADGRTASFDQIEAGANAWLAAHAPEAGMLSGRAVVFALPNGIAWIEFFLGLLKAGAVAVPLDASEPPEAWRRVAESVRAGYWWDGARLVPLPRAKAYRGAEVCLVKLTSGSTGRPRPLVFTAAQMLADARQVTATMGISPCDLNYALIPFGHSYGLGNLVLPLLAQGVPIVCGAAALPHAIAADFARWRPTVFPGVPAVWRALAMANVALDGLKLGISAGAPLLPEVAREFTDRCGQRLHNFYGSSETGGIAYDRTGDETLRGGVGRALRGVKLALLPGRRLQVASAAVMTRGNRRRDGAHGAWVMADCVQVDEHGGLTLLGRRGTSVKIAGRRVNLGEVAARLRRLRGVRDVWVGVSPGAGTLLGAALVADRTATELRAELLADTAPWKIPKKWAVLPALPVTARGKLYARALTRLVFA